MAAEVVDGRSLALSAHDIFDRLPCRAALLAECARRATAAEAYELAAVMVSHSLLRQLSHEIHLEVVQGRGVALGATGSLITSGADVTLVYRLRRSAGAEPGRQLH